MTPSQISLLGQIMHDHFTRCWNSDGLANPKDYVAIIEVHFRADGSLAVAPVLVNPSSDPRARAIGESAVAAVRGCGPMPVPQALLPTYNIWKDSKLGLNPNSL